MKNKFLYYKNFPFHTFQIIKKAKKILIKFLFLIFKLKFKLLKNKNSQKKIFSFKISYFQK